MLIDPKTDRIRKYPVYNENETLTIKIKIKLH